MTQADSMMNDVARIGKGSRDEGARGDAAPFSPPWFGGFQDLTRSHGFEPLRVTGTLPPALRGTLYRNGPGRFSVAGERYRHWFDGDGAVSAVRFADGRASGAARVTLDGGTSPRGKGEEAALWLVRHAARAALSRGLPSATGRTPPTPP